MAIDAKGQPRRALVPGTSAPGTVRLSIGGVARNVAENLARLGVHATLLSAVGDDPMGRFLLDATAHAGVNVEHVLVRRGQRSGAYIAVLNRPPLSRRGDDRVRCQRPATHDRDHL